MRVLMLSWEYPPKIVGGIARHVEEIAWALAKQGVEVHVVTCEFPGAPAEEVFNGVRIHRVAPYNPTDNFFHWVHQLNAAMRHRAEELLNEWIDGEQPPRLRGFNQSILIHAHDWLAHFSGASLKHTFKLPLIATVHATEYGRNNGIYSDVQRYISGVEWELGQEAWRVIVCSDFMKHEVERALSVPRDKMDVIPNGVHSEKFDFDFAPDDASQFRSRFASPQEKLVFFVGRMVPEKGANVLLDAFPQVRAAHTNAKLVIVGGGNRDHLVEQAKRLGISEQVYFTGFIQDEELLKLYKVIDAACFPSLYEPFGIVALEAMTANVPVVVSDAGGLREVVEHDVSGTHTYAGDPSSLAWGINRVLENPTHARWMAANASRRVNELFNWDRIATMTRGVYERVWGEFQHTEWR